MERDLKRAISQNKLTRYEVESEDNGPLSVTYLYRKLPVFFGESIYEEPKRIVINKKYIQEVVTWVYLGVGAAEEWNREYEVLFIFKYRIDGYSQWSDCVTFSS